MHKFKYDYTVLNHILKQILVCLENRADWV